MAIVNIKYDLSDPDDVKALQRAMYSLDMANFIFEVLHNGKRRFKHCEEIDLDEIWQYLWEVASEHKIDIDNLVE